MIHSTTPVRHAWRLPLPRCKLFHADPRAQVPRRALWCCKRQCFKDDGFRSGVVRAPVQCDRTSPWKVPNSETSACLHAPRAIMPKRNFVFFSLREVCIWVGPLRTSPPCTQRPHRVTHIFPSASSSDSATPQCRSAKNECFDTEDDDTHDDRFCVGEWNALAEHQKRKRCRRHHLSQLIHLPCPHPLFS